MVWLACVLSSLPKIKTADPVALQVDGVPVLRANNYDIETGERSVFDQELKRE